jgi:hypothetical protein
VSIKRKRFIQFALLSLFLASALGCYEEVVRFDGREPFLPRGGLELEYRRLDGTGRRGAIPPGTTDAWRRDIEFEGVPGSYLLRFYLDASYRRVEETAASDEWFQVGSVSSDDGIVSGQFDMAREEAGIFQGMVTPGQVFRFGMTAGFVLYQAWGKFENETNRAHWSESTIMLGVGLRGEMSPGFPPLRIYGHAGFSLNLMHSEVFWEGGVRLQLAGFFFTLGYREETVWLGELHDLGVIFRMRGPVFGSGITF